MIDPTAYQKALLTALAKEASDLAAGRTRAPPGMTVGGELQNLAADMAGRAAAAAALARRSTGPWEP